MKRTLLLLGLLLPLLPPAGEAAQTAPARTYCQSLRFQQATDNSTLFTLDLSTFASWDNGELGPYFYFFDPSTTHSAYLHVVDTLFYDDYPGGMDLDAPGGDDANGNGWSDFFEVSQGISASISGLGSGSVAASWFRNAGSQLGTCILTFQNTSYGNIVFAATYELFEYTGPLTYTPGSSSVSGTVNLAQSGDPASTFQGPVTFAKSPTDRFNELEFQPGVWTNAAAQSLTFTNGTFYRNAGFPTNYYGYVDFDDGDPNTSDPDYYIWVFSIDDPNDSDHDGIPDFSDDPPAPRRPRLTLTRGTTNLWLGIAGDTNHIHHIQEITNVLSTNWQTVVSLTLTNDPQTVSLPLPTSNPRFWRVQAE